MNAAPHVDLVVVGAGILGLATAWSARQRGLSVAVVERHARCIGASVRNFGFVTVSGQGPEAHWLRARRSAAVWADLAPQAGIPILQRGALVLAQRAEAAAVLESFASSAGGEGCRLLSAEEARARAPGLRAGAAVLYSPHELRVESREALPRLARWLEQAQGVGFHWQTTVQAIDLPWVSTNRGRLRAERCIVCPGHDLGGLPPQWLGDAAIRICTLQMLRLAPAQPLRLGSPLISDLSLIRYPGFASLPAAAALRHRLAQDLPDHLAAGVHVIAVQSADGSLVVGDSHRYGEAEAAFAEARVDDLIVDELQRMLDLPGARVTERWMGSYASASEPVFISRPAPGLVLGLVTSGTGASTCFALGEELLALSGVG